MLAPPAAYPATVVAPLSRGLRKSSGLTSRDPSSSTLWYTFGRVQRIPSLEGYAVRRGVCIREVRTMN